MPVNPSAKPFFSLIVPTYERPEDLRKCLHSIVPSNQIDAPSYEIIVSDDSKGNQSQKITEEFSNVSWIRGKQIGPAGNRNAGVSKSKGRWIVFLDDDCIAESGLLNAYYKAIQNNPNIFVFEGRIFANRPRKTWAEGCPENEYGGMLWTSNLCVNKKIFSDLGGLDEQFEIAYEDVDFALRLKKQGIQSRFIYEAAACHPWRTLKNEGKNWKKKGYQFQELLIFLEKHPEQYQNHSSKVFIRNALRGLIKEFPRGFIDFRGRGSLFKIIRIFQSINAALAVKKWKFSHDSKN